MADSKIQNKEIKYEITIDSIPTNPVTINEQNPVSILENGSIMGHFDETEFSEHQNHEKEAKVREELKKRIEQISCKIKESEQNNSFLRKGFSWLKNNVFDFMSSSTNDVKKAQKLELESLNSEDLKKVFFEITGMEYTDANADKFLKGEILTKSEKALTEYTESQNGFTEFGSDMASGWISGLVYTVAGTTIAALGAPAIAVVGGAITCAALVGAVSKVAIKASSAKNSNEAYNSLGMDTLVGGINGIFAPLAAIGGGKIATSVVKKLGGGATKAITNTLGETIEKGVEYTADKASSKLTTFLNPYGYQYTGSNLIKAVGYSTEYSVGGAIQGGVDAAARTAYNGGDAGEVFGAAGQGAMFGSLSSLGFGWALKGLGSTLHRKAYDKGLEINDGHKSINDEALIEAGANPAKRYKLPQQNSSGYLYSGLPIMQIARFLGKPSKFKTINDVAENYLKQRFYAMKQHTPELFNEFMNAPIGQANPLYDIEISPKTFVEDILFNETDLSPFDLMQFTKFKSKFNMEAVEASLEDLLGYYEATTPQVYRLADESAAVVYNRASRAQEGSQAKVNNDVNTSTEALTTATDNVPTSAGNSADVLPQPLKKQGVRPDYEKILLEDIELNEASGNIQLRNDLVEIFNKYCGLNRERGKKIMKIFIQEYNAEKGNPEKLNLIIQKYKSMPLQDNATTPVRTTSTTDTPATDTPITDTPITDTPITDTPATDTPITDTPTTDTPTTDTSASAKPTTDTPVTDAPKKTKSTSGKAKTQRVSSNGLLELVPEAAEAVLSKMAKPEFLSIDLNRENLTKITDNYLKSRIGAKREPVENPIGNSLLATENLVLVLHNSPSNVDQKTLNQHKSKAGMHALKASIKNLQREYRAEFISKIIKELDGEINSFDEILEIVIDQYGWNISYGDSDFRAIVKMAEIKSKIEANNLSKIFGTTRLTPENIEFIDNIITIKELAPNFSIPQEKNKLQFIVRVYKNIGDNDKLKLIELLDNNPKLDINEADFNFWLTNLKDSSSIDFTTAYTIGKELKCPLNKLFSSDGNIFEMLSKSAKESATKMLNGENIDNDSKNIISQYIKKIYGAFGVNDFASLKTYMKDNSIESFSVSSNKGFNIKFGNISVQEKFKIINELYNKLLGGTNYTYRDKSPKLSIDDIIKELNHQIGIDRDKHGGNNSYSRLYKYLGIDKILGVSDVSTLKNITEIDKTMFSKEQLAKCEELCKALNEHPDSDLLQYSHPRMRFLERVVLEESINMDITNINDAISNGFKVLNDVMSQDLHIETYDMANSNTGAKIVFRLGSGTGHIGLDGKNNIRTIVKHAYNRNF